MSRLRVVEGPEAGRELEVTDAAVIGRSATAAGLVIQDPEASRRHATLIPEGEGLSVEDLGSTNGTFVNGERIAEKRVLAAGDRIELGTSVLELLPALVVEPEEAPPEVEAPLEVERAPPVSEHHARAAS